MKIIKATYYNPQLGCDSGTDVTEQATSEVRNEKLFYNGTYNRIFPDHFKSIRKKLRIEIEYLGKRYTKYYNENEKISLPDDLGIKNERWWEKTWVQALMLIAAIVGILSFILSIYK